MVTIDIEFECLNELDWIPRGGMEFEFKQLAYEFYNLYGHRMEFSIRRDTSGKNKRTSEITSMIFVCSKKGYRSKYQRDVLTIKSRVASQNA